MLRAMKNSYFNQVTVELAISSLLSLLGIPSPLLFFLCSHSTNPHYYKTITACLLSIFTRSGARLRSIQSSRSMARWVIDVLVLAHNHFGVLNHFENPMEVDCFMKIPIQSCTESSLTPGNQCMELYPGSQTKNSCFRVSKGTES